MTLAGGDRWLYAIDGARLLQISMGTLRERVIAEMPESGRKLSVSEDGLNAVFAEKDGAVTRLRFTPTGKPGLQTVVEFDGVLTEVGVRPKRAGLFYVRDGGLWLASFDGKENRQLKTPSGQVLEAQWSPDGRTILYLLQPGDGVGKLNEMREYAPDGNADAMLGKTSQFVRFAPNGDATVDPSQLRRINRTLVPAAVFGHPQVATVGLRERDAVAAGIPYVVASKEFGSTAYGWAMDDSTSICKLIAHRETRLLLGAHLVGPQASTLIQPLIQAMHFGQTVDQLAHDVWYIHPALTEVVENALLDLF